jgi:hypothetical protein
MKRKVKRYDGGGYGRFVEESPSMADAPSDLDTMKSKLAAGAPAADESDTYAAKTRTFTTVKPNRPKPRPRPAAKTESSSPVDDMDFQQNAAMVMRKGQAGPSDSGKNAALESYKRDKKEREFNAARKSAAEERRNTARSTVASSPVTGAGFKKGGKTASARADGIAQRGKTRA